MTPKDSHQLTRGIYKVACNKNYGIATYGWLDGNPVHLMTTADGSGVTHVSCQVAREKLQLKMALWNMGIGNDDIHFHEQNSQRKMVKNHCYLYHNNLGYGFINTNWAEFAKQ
eukprot:15340463-Ditylum_brightwellii.AAC.1